MASIMRSRTPSRRPRASSGSRSATSSIDPLTSAKSTVTSLRSPSIAARVRRILSARWLGTAGEVVASRSSGPPSALPQASQKRAPAGKSRAQLGQRLASRAPHWRQKRESARFCSPHEEHCIESSVHSVGGYLASRPSPLLLEPRADLNYLSIRACGLVPHDGGERHGRAKGSPRRSARDRLRNVRRGTGVGYGHGRL